MAVVCFRTLQVGTGLGFWKVRWTLHSWGECHGHVWPLLQAVIDHDCSCIPNSTHLYHLRGVSLPDLETWKSRVTCNALHGDPGTSLLFASGHSVSQQALPAANL